MLGTALWSHISPYRSGSRNDGETEREYAKALQQLAVYAYKDTTQLHKEGRCLEQFLAGLRCRDVKAHLSWFCTKDAKVHELVSREEAFRAMHEENALMSDTEGNAVTVAYILADKPGKSYVQHQHSAPASGVLKPQDVKKPNTQQRKYSKKAKSCVGKCCFKCGKEGHFIAECRSTSNKCLYLAFDGDLRCDDRSSGGECKCVCGLHSHFMNHEDEQVAMSVMECTLEKPAK